ncbi:MAG: AMP-binding protein [Gammaproteobacteria bacterium]|nr:AMP-binding protein [Gammaproteobacteria bacterium]
MNLQFPETACLTDAISGDTYSLTEIKQQVSAWQQRLQSYVVKRIVFRAQSSVQWALLDLACLDANILLVPVPSYLSDEQWKHVLQQVTPDLIIADVPFQVAPEFAAAGDVRWVDEFGGYQLYQSHVVAKIAAPDDTQKVTFTSGSTGQPKGVCLSAASQLQVASSLVERINLAQPRHLCLLPLPTLLENIAGIYAPLLAGGEVLIAPETARGLNGSRLENPALLLGLITKVQPQTLILVPELLQLLVHASSQGWTAPASLKFIAVGGAKVAVDLLKQAALCGLPVYQGYGLSECCSVVALQEKNALDASDLELQQVGKVLPHLQVKIVADEIWVKTPFLGYFGAPADASQDWVQTGDLGAQTDNGNLLIWGRQKNLLILSSGRNVNPEWVEAELLKTGLLQQAVLFGDARPYCVAVLFCANPAITDSQLGSFIHSVNQHLPDYARVERFIRLTSPLSERQGTYTANGRPKRAVIADLYANELAVLYQPDFESSALAGYASTEGLSAVKHAAPQLVERNVV